MNLTHHIPIVFITLVVSAPFSFTLPADETEQQTHAVLILRQINGLPISSQEVLTEIFQRGY